MSENTQRNIAGKPYNTWEWAAPGVLFPRKNSWQKANCVKPGLVQELLLPDSEEEEGCWPVHALQISEKQPHLHIHVKNIQGLFSE